jgi:hypothetical protein
MLPEVRMARIVDAIGVVSHRKVELFGGFGAFGGERAAFSPTAGRLRGEGGGRAHRQAARAGVGPAGALDEIERVLEKFRTRYFACRASGVIFTHPPRP